MSDAHPVHITADGRRFELVREESYLRKSDGSTATVLVWQGTCRVCGASYLVRSPVSLTNTKSFHVVHCEAHRLSRAESVERWLRARAGK